VIKHRREAPVAKGLGSISIDGSAACDLLPPADAAGGGPLRNGSNREEFRAWLRRAIDAVARLALDAGNGPNDVVPHLSSCTAASPFYRVFDRHRLVISPHRKRRRSVHRTTSFHGFDRFRSAVRSCFMAIGVVSVATLKAAK
jgi:hypothetical protein